MKKLFIILFVIAACSEEKVIPDYNVIGRYISLDPDFQVSLVIKSDEVIWNNVWIGNDYKVVNDILYFSVQHNDVVWNFELRITDDGLEGYHYRNNITTPEKRSQEGTIKLLKQ